MGKKKDPGAALRAQAAANMAEVTKRLDAVDLPDYMKQQAYINLMAEQVPEIAGILQAEQMDTPEDIQEDPRLAGLKMQALESLSERGKAGLSEEDQLKYEDARMAMAADAASQQSDIERRMAEKGAGGSGQELAMRLAGQQGSAQRASEFGRGMAADALQAKMQSEQAAGAMAGQMSAQDMANQRANQQAKQAIAQFNAMNRQNVASQNLAQRQQQANQRAALQQQKYGQLGGLEQQKFSNQMAKTGAVTGALTSQANMLNQQSQMQKGGSNMAGMLGTVGTVAGGVIGGIYGGGPAGAAAGASIGGAVGSGAGSMMDGAADGGIVAKDGAVVHAANGLASAGSFDPYARARQAREGRTIGGDLNVFRSQMKGLMGGEGMPTKEDPYGFESQIAAQSAQNNLTKMGSDGSTQAVKAPGAEYTQASQANPGQAADVTKMSEGAGGDSASGLQIASAIAKALPKGQAKKAPEFKYTDVDAPKVQLVQDQVFGRPFADGGIPGYVAEDGANISVDGGFVSEGDEDQYAGDRVDAKLNRGEMVLNAEQQQRLLDLLRGELSPEDLTRLFSSEEDIVEEPEQEEARGLMKVLEMVGRK